MDPIHNKDWIMVPNSQYVMKYLFQDSSYHVMVTNLTHLYSEELSAKNILNRTLELNPFIEMTSTVVLERLEKALEKCLIQETQLTIIPVSDQLNLSLEFPVGREQIPCKYNFELNLLNAEKFTEHVLSPTVLNALLSQRKILELQKKLLANEAVRSSLTSTIPVAVSPNPVDVALFKGNCVSSVTLLDSFLKLQTAFKDLQAENLQAYTASRKEKSENDQSAPSTSKKLKIQENADGISSSIKFEDGDERIPIQEEETTGSANYSSQIKGMKKKKQFKI